MDNGSRMIALGRRAIDAAIVALVLLVLIGLFLGRVVPLTGRDTLIIGGRSMEPAIPMGAAIVIEPVTASELSVGDVVTMRVGAKPSIFTHRIVRLLTLDGQPYIETKGDANAAPDGATTPVTSVVGRVAWSIPLAGYLLALLSIPAGIAFVIGLGITLVLSAILLEDLEEPRPASEERPWTGPDPEVKPAYLRPPLEGRVAHHLAAHRRLSPQVRPPGRSG
jgi:signal peptidase